MDRSNQAEPHQNLWAAAAAALSGGFLGGRPQSMTPISRSRGPRRASGGNKKRPSKEKRRIRNRMARRSWRINRMRSQR